MSLDDSSLPPFRHRVYGMTVASWTRFPELQTASSADPVEAVFRLGEVPETLGDRTGEGTAFQVAPERLLARHGDLVRFLVRDGREIVVQPAPGAELDEIRTLLLCSPMGGLLLQRKRFPIHASVVATEQGAVGFMGHSGSGKSTLAAFLETKGYPVIADDIAVIHFSANGSPVVSPGYPSRKLWPEALRELGMESDELPRVRPGLDKRMVSFHGTHHDREEPLIALYQLLPDADRSRVELGVPQISDVVQELIMHTYRRQYLPGLGLQPEHLRWVGRLASAVPIRQLQRPVDGAFYLDEMVELVVADLAGRSSKHDGLSGQACCA